MSFYDDYDNAAENVSIDDIYDGAAETGAAPESPAAQFYQGGPFSRKIAGEANIVVVGVGGAGGNAVNNMVAAGIRTATFIVMNTDVQALKASPVPERCKFQLGEKTTKGLGAGSNPEVGKRAAEESRDKIKEALEGIDLLFITAGMGGGTGTGAAPVVAEIAKDLGILTVGVVTKPFLFEGDKRMKNAEAGIEEIRKHVDTLLVIPNQNLAELLKNQKVGINQAFKMADDVLRQGIQGVSEVIVNPGLINLDFADVRTVLSEQGLAYMGIGFGQGEKRVYDAVRSAVGSPLIETSIQGATALLINIIGGDDMTLAEVEEACSFVGGVVSKTANIILGTSTRPELTEKKAIEITIIATGFTGAQKSAPTFGAVNSTVMPRGPVVTPAAPNPAYAGDRGPMGGFGVAPQPQRPAEAQRETPPPSDVHSSRVGVVSRPSQRGDVPKFLRRIKDEENND